MWSFFSARDCDMVKDSVILLEQLRTIDKQRLREKICHIDGGAVRPGGRGAEGQLGTWRLLGKCL